MAKVKVLDSMSGREKVMDTRFAKILTGIKPQRYRTRDMIMERAASREDLPVLTDEVEEEEVGKSGATKRKRSKAQPE